MDKYGLVHDKLDIKILILYILNRLPDLVDESTLAELCQCDAGVGYFDYAECLSELVDTGHVYVSGGKYASTEKGRRNGTTIESSIPYTVRVKAEKALAPVAQDMRRRAMITASHTVDGNGSIAVTLGMSDGVSDVIAVQLLVPDEVTANTIEKNFRADAEGLYGKIMSLLIQE